MQGRRKGNDKNDNANRVIIIIIHIMIVFCEDYYYDYYMECCLYSWKNAKKTSQWDLFVVGHLIVWIFSAGMLLEGDKMDDEKFEREREKKSFLLQEWWRTESQKISDCDQSKWRNY